MVVTSTTTGGKPDTAYLGMRAPLTLKAALKDIAHEQHTDVSALMGHVLAEFVARHHAARTTAAQDSGYRDPCAHCGRIPAMSIIISRPDETRRVACVPFCTPPQDVDGFPVTLGCAVRVYLAETAADIDEADGRVVSLSADPSGRPVADIELPGRPYVLVQRTDLLRVIR